MSIQELARALPVVLLLTAACQTAAPPAPQLPELPLRWSASVVDSGGPGSGAPWWSQFRDPQLEALISEALTHNHDLQAAAARVEAAAAQARIAGADLKPQASATLNPARRRQNFIGFPIPGNEEGVLSSTSTTVGAQLNVSWEIDLWGRLRAGKAASAAGFEAAQNDYAAAQLSLAAQTAKAYFALVEAGEQTTLAQSTLASRASTREQIENRYQAGLRSALHLRLAKTNEALAASRLSSRERQLDSAKRQLELLLSRYPAANLNGSSISSTLVRALEPVPVGLPSELILQRPDLVAAERRLSGAGFSVQQARAALLPRISLSGSAGRSSDDLDDLLNSDFSVWNLAANLLQPVFQGGRLRGAVDLSEAQYRETAAKYLQSVLVAFAEVESTLTAERLLQRQQQALADAARQAVESQRLAEDRYHGGLGDYLSVLTAQVQAQEAQSQYLQAQRQRLSARVDLHLALGGDWGGQGTS